MSRQRVSICREGLYYVAMMAFIVGGAQIREVNLLMFIAAIMVGPLVISWRMVYVVLGKLTVTRHLPDCCTAGETLTVELRARNTRRRLPCWAIQLTDPVRAPSVPLADGPSPSHPVHVLLQEVPPEGEAIASYTLRLMDRGHYQIGPLTIETRFPLGLIRRRVTLGQRHQVTAYPRRGQLVGNWRRALRSPREGTQQMAHRVGLLEGDFHAFRDWQVGDSRRWIHWRTSARRGQLTVRQFDQQTDQDIVLLLDLTSDHATDVRSDAGVDRYAAHEQAIRFVATVAAAVCRTASQRITVGIAGSTVQHVTGPSSSALLHTILEQLALAQPGHPDRLRELSETVAADLGQQQHVLWVAPQAIDTARHQEIASMLGRSVTDNGSLQIVAVESQIWNEIFRDAT